MKDDFNHKMPQLRFPEFSGEWEEKMLGEIFEKHNEKNDLSFGVDQIISVANMYYKQDANVGNDDYLRTYNIFRLGNIAYEGNKSSNFAYGRFVENTIGDGIVSHVFDVYRPIVSDYCIDFWKYAINYEPIMRPILEKATIKSTMMNNLIAKDFLKQSTLIPPTLAEQQKIAEFLSSVDDVIAAENDRLTALKNHKKGLMQQLFPQKDQTQPSKRFPEFNGEWEVKTLGEIADRCTSRNRDKAETRVLTNSATDGVVDQSAYFDRDIAVKDNTDNYHIVELNDFVYNPRVSSSAPVGPISRNKVGRGVMSPLYNVFRFKVGYLDFFEQYFNTASWHGYLREVANVGARFDRMAISTENFYDMPIYFPPISEQKKIADCLTSLDDEIQAQQQKVDALKEYKRGLMQKLFPTIK